ncbi:glycogen debranching protein GlgX [Rhabdothermincola sediminis]|uniref:glycogen debranching protein GlgX n=1 Tax=Rhabdothermincola sediminis TaxID=2751370 RepID=UPI0022A89B81
MLQQLRRRWPRLHSAAVEVWPGEPFPLGATFDGAGTNFSIFSEVAERVELCLFDDDGHEERLDLPEVTAFIHHGYLPGIQPGQRYGFRVHGPWAPEEGSLANPAKLLIDPYAKAVEGQVDWAEAVFPFLGDPHANEPSHADSAPFVPKSVVISPYFDWSDDRHPRTPWHETVVYETHVKGLTWRHPEVREELRGTYLGLCSRPVIDHLKKLGVTAVELMPVHQFVHDHRLEQLGLRNYWGYNSIAFLAPHNEYAVYGQRGHQVQEFKQMVKILHAEGIEVILDVVYNHTAEGNHLGPMLSLKGADNAAYYRLDPADRRRYVDYTGTGNSLNMRHPHVLQLIMDSLRYWVLEMHVDGFRFDLAATLARELHDVDKLSAFFDLIQQDPVVSQVKLIAEPWDVGEGGYQVGNFPPLWSEWNGRYRDEVRDFWRGVDNTVAEFAYRFTGSSDLYESNGRTPSASINFVTCHDGFTLADLVSYNDKHNEANGEDNRDGTDDNRSWNCGVEGPTDDPEVIALRRRQRRNLLATLMLSQGVPMLLGGDEIGRTQQGNNNAYAQDSALSWYDWEHADEAFLHFTRALIRLRSEHPVFRRPRFFQGRAIQGEDVDDIGWFTPEGTTMTEADWSAGFARALAVFLNGDAIPARTPRGEPVRDDSFYVLFNASDDALEFTLPDPSYGEHWVKVLDTFEDAMKHTFPRPDGEAAKAGESVTVRARSVVLLRRVDGA